MTKGHRNTIKRINSWFNGFDFYGFGDPVYLVGGVVRDLLLGRDSKDIDVVCKNAYELAQNLSKLNRASIVEWKKPGLEVVTYRLARKSPKDNHDFFDVAGFRASSLGADLRSRDFTINAMALPISENGFGDLVDPLKGETDLLTHRRIKMAGSSAFGRRSASHSSRLSVRGAIQLRNRDRNAQIYALIQGTPQRCTGRKNNT